MSQKLLLGAGLGLAFLGAAVVFSAPAHAADRCKVTDPTGTPLNIRDQRKNVIGTIENGRIVMVERYSEDSRGRPWVYVTTPAGKGLGWVYREFVSCF